MSWPSRLQEMRSRCEAYASGIDFTAGSDGIATDERLEVIGAFLNGSHTRNDIEHLGRYELAGEFVKGKFVVDCACGTGYGARVLAVNGAAKVLGVDIDPSTVEYAQRTYGSPPQVQFACADALSLGRLVPEPPDAVVSFETVNIYRQFCRVSMFPFRKFGRTSTIGQNWWMGQYGGIFLNRSQEALRSLACEANNMVAIAQRPL